MASFFLSTLQIQSSPHSYKTTTLCPSHLPVIQRNSRAVELSYKLSSFFLNLAHSPDSCLWLETLHTFRHLLSHLWTGIRPCCQVPDCASQEQVLCSARWCPDIVSLRQQKSTSSKTWSKGQCNTRTKALVVWRPPPDINPNKCHEFWSEHFSIKGSI